MADYVPLIDPRDLRIYRVPSAKANLYKENGWAEPIAKAEPEHIEALKRDLSGWYENGQAVAFTFARGIPLATKALSKVVDKATFQNLALKAKILDENHPLLSKGLEISGGLATIPIGGLIGKGLGAAAGFAGDALGLGAEAAGEATGVGLGEAAAATGDAASAGAEAVAEGDAGLAQASQLERPAATGPDPEAVKTAYQQEIANTQLVDPAERISGVPLSGEGIEAGAVETGAGAGAEAAGAAKKTNLADLLTRYPKVTQASKLAGIGAAQNVGFGAAYRIDNQALEHALDPQGQEKLTFEANDVLLDAATGAALPLGLSALGSGLGKLGSKLKDNSITMFRGAVLKGDMLDAAMSQGRQGSFYRLLDSQMGKGEGEIARNMIVKQKTAEQGMEVIKARYEGVFLTNEQKGQILNEVKRITGTHEDPLFIQIRKGLNKRRDIQGLQALTKKVDKGPNIVWNDGKFAENPRNIIGRDVRDVLAGWQRKLIEVSGVSGAEDAAQWQRLNQQSSDAQLILGSLASKRGQGTDEFLSKLGVAALSGGALGAAGLAGNAGIATAAAQTAGWQAVRHVRIKHVAPFVNKLGKVLLATDQKIAKVLDAGLRGVPGQVHKAYESPDYDSVAAAVSLAGSDPAKTIANLQTHQNEQGIPEEISVPIVQTQAAGLAHLAKSLPARNDAVDVSTTDTGDPVQQHRWLEQVKTFQDPTYGLANPTADNLRILKQFYPQTLFTAQQALYNQIANNPDLPSEGIAWASRILERPLNNLESPTFAQTLMQSRQQRQAAPPPSQAQRGGGSQNGVESSLTRADQLQNR